MTTYDELWKTFLDNCKLSDLDIPQNEKIYDSIQNAVLHFNNRKRDELVADDDTELLNRQLNGDDLLLLAQYIRLSVLDGQRLYFTNIWNPFSKDVGLKNYSAQLKSKELLVKEQRALIDEIILNSAEDFL